MTLVVLYILHHSKTMMISLTPQTCSAQETIEHVKKQKKKRKKKKVCVWGGGDCLLLIPFGRKGTHTLHYTQLVEKTGWTQNIQNKIFKYEHQFYFFKLSES